MNFSSEQEFVRYMEEENPGALTPVYQLADAIKAMIPPASGRVFF